MGVRSVSLGFFGAFGFRRFRSFAGERRGTGGAAIPRGCRSGRGVCRLSPNACREHPYVVSYEGTEKTLG